MIPASIVKQAQRYLTRLPIALFFTAILLLWGIPLYSLIKFSPEKPAVADPYDFTSAGEEAESANGHIWIFKDGNWYDVQRVRKPDGSMFVWKVDKEQLWRSTWVKASKQAD